MAYYNNTMLPNQNPNYYGGAPLMQQVSQPSALKGRPVSSFEEASAAQIDFDGSLFIFPNIANKKIYTKQIGIDGSLIFNQYDLVEPPPAPSFDNFITREEFEQFKQMLESHQTASKPTPINNF